MKTLKILSILFIIRHYFYAITFIKNIFNNIVLKTKCKNNKNKLSNFGVTSCNVLSSKENIESNSGFYSLLIILIIFIIIFIIFYSKGYNII